MPTVNEVLGGYLQNALAHPKTTIQSILTTLMVGIVALMTCNCLPQKYLAILGGVMAVCKVGLGMIQSDGTPPPPDTALLKQIQKVTPDGSVMTSTTVETSTNS